MNTNPCCAVSLTVILLYYKACCAVELRCTPIEFVSLMTMPHVVGRWADEMVLVFGLQSVKRPPPPPLACMHARRPPVHPSRPSTWTTPDFLLVQVPFFLLPAIGGIGVFVAVYVLSHSYDVSIDAAVSLRGPVLTNTKQKQLYTYVIQY